MLSGKAGLIAFVGFEATRTTIFAILRSCGVSKETAEQFAFDSALTAAALVATTASILTFDLLGFGFAAAFLGAAVAERQQKKMRSRQSAMRRHKKAKLAQASGQS